MRSMVVVALLGLASTAHAADDVDAAVARKHFEDGTKAYDLGHYNEAVRHYEEAFRLKDAPELLFNIGQAYRLAGDHAQALRSYRAYLRRVPNAANRAEVEAKIAELEKLIAQEESAKQGPPEGTITPATTTPTTPTSTSSPTVALTMAPVAAPERKPIYKRAWFWGVVGGAVIAVALGVGLGVGLSQSSTTWPSANTTLGTVRW